MPLLRGAHPTPWRTAYLIEHRVEAGVSQPARAPAKNSTLEPPDPDEAIAHRLRHREIRDTMLLNRAAEIPDYDALRTGQVLYVEYANGDRELYDLRTDPDEIVNLAGTEPGLERALAHRLSQLRRCAGSGCRLAENRPFGDASGREA